MPTHLERDFSGAGGVGDFWRSGDTNVAGAFPDGVNDTTEIIHREGRTAIQSSLGAIPAFVNPPMLDIANGARSGIEGRNTLSPLYATANLTGIGDVTSPPATPTVGAEFRHSNQTQGIGITFDGLYATGSNANQAFHFLQRGAGIFQFIHQTLNGGFNFFDRVGPAIAGNQGWQNRYFAAGALEFSHLMRRSALALPGGGTLANEIFFQKRVENGAIHNSLALRNSLCTANTGRIEIDGNNVTDDKLVLWGQDSTAFFGLGIKGATLAYFVNANTSHHRWYAGACPGTQILGLSGVGNVTVDPNGTSAGGFTGPLLRFGSETSVEAIKSQRTGAGALLNALSFYTNAVNRFNIKANGFINIPSASIPLFANDGAAGVGGLVQGDLWRDALGVVHWKL